MILKKMKNYGFNLYRQERLNIVFSCVTLFDKSVFVWPSGELRAFFKNLTGFEYISSRHKVVKFVAISKDCLAPNTTSTSNFRNSWQTGKEGKTM